MESYREYIKEIKSICKSKWFRFNPYRLRNWFDFIIIEIAPKVYEKTILIIAGLHWNEKAPVYALKEFLKELEGENDVSARIFILPCMNPFWFQNDLRKNDNWVDLNRVKRSKFLEEEQSLLFQHLFNIKFDGVLSMHEDNWTNKTYFYAYNGENECKYRYILQEVWKVAELNLKDKIDWNLAKQGIIYDKSDSSLENYLHCSWIGFILCSETGWKWNINSRINANSVLISCVAICD